MGKLIPRLIGLFPKLEGGKYQVGSEAEVGISTKGEKDQSGRDLWRGTFPSSDAHLLIFSRMLSLVSFLCFVEEVRNRPWLHSILSGILGPNFMFFLNHLNQFSRSYVRAG